jgi:uncharacterized ferritin-like protein (DUF455 family)
MGEELQRFPTMAACGGVWSVSDRERVAFRAGISAMTDYAKLSVRYGDDGKVDRIWSMTGLNADGTYTTHASTRVVLLADALDALLSERDRLRSALRRVSIWDANNNTHWGCRACGKYWWRDEPERHDPDCLAIEGAAHD